MRQTKDRGHRGHWDSDMGTQGHEDRRLRTRRMETRKLLAMEHTDMKDIEMQDKSTLDTCQGQDKGHGGPGTCDTGQRIESHRSCDTGWGLKGTETCGGTWHLGPGTLGDTTWSMKSTARMEVVTGGHRGCWAQGTRWVPSPQPLAFSVAPPTGAQGTQILKMQTMNLGTQIIQDMET